MQMPKTKQQIIKFQSNMLAHNIKYSIEVHSLFDMLQTSVLNWMINYIYLH